MIVALDMRNSELDSYLLIVHLAIQTLGMLKHSQLCDSASKELLNLKETWNLVFVLLLLSE